MLQDEEMKLAGDLPRNVGLYRPKFVRIKLISAGPTIFGCRSVGNLHIDAEHRRAAPLSAPGYDIFYFWIARPRRDIDPRLVCDEREGHPATAAHKIGDQIVGKGFHHILLTLVAGQIAQRRDANRNVWR